MNTNKETEDRGASGSRKEKKKKRLEIYRNLAREKKNAEKRRGYTKSEGNGREILKKLSLLLRRIEKKKKNGENANANENLGHGASFELIYRAVRWTDTTLI